MKIMIMLKRSKNELKRIEEEICNGISLFLSEKAGEYTVEIEMSPYTIECRNPGSNKIIERLDEIILILNEREGAHDRERNNRTYKKEKA